MNPMPKSPGRTTMLAALALVDLAWVVSMLIAGVSSA